jgi:hypothetical protein
LIRVALARAKTVKSFSGRPVYFVGRITNGVLKNIFSIIIGRCKNDLNVCGYLGAGLGRGGRGGGRSAEQRRA